MVRQCCGKVAVAYLQSSLATEKEKDRMRIRNCRVYLFLFIPFCLFIFVSCAGSIKQEQRYPSVGSKKPLHSSPQSETVPAWILYKGANECGDLRSEVSFTYDSDSQTILNFVLEHGCIDGHGLHMRRLPIKIKVKSDGTFYHQDKANRFLYIKGKILEDGTFEGEHDNGFVSTGCGDVNNPSCRKWKAAPVK